MNANKARGPQLSPQPPSVAQPQTAPRAAAARSVLGDELRRATATGLHALLELMLRSADEALLKLAEQGGEAERRRCLALQQALRIDHARLLRAMLHTVDQSWNALAPVRSAAPESTDEQVALTNLSSRAKKLHREAIGEMQRRLERALASHAAPFAPQALAPARLCDALRASLAPLELDLPSRLLVYRLFDRTVVAGLGPVYAEVNQILERHGLSAPAPAAATAGASTLDAATRRCLEAVAGNANAPGDDARLARELLRSVDSADSAGSVAVLQRLALVTQMFGEMLADPQLPAALAGPFSELRFPIIRCALADDSFFERPDHPVRQLLDEAAQQSVCSRVGGEAVLRQLGQRLGALPAQIEVHIAPLALALARLAPLDGVQVARFLESQRAAVARRRETLLAKVRGAAAQELEVQMLGQQLPDGAAWLLRAALGPLLAVRLLRFGATSRLWNDAVDRLAQVLRTLQPAVPAPERGQLREELCVALAADLRDAGLPEERVIAFLRNLQTVHAALDRDARAGGAMATDTVTPRELQALLEDFATAPTDAPAIAAPLAAPAAAAQTPEALLARVLVPGQWFRIGAAEGGQTRWLRVETYYPLHDSVGLTGFDRNSGFKLGAKRLLDDLRGGCCEPVTPTADMQRALALLRERVAA